MYLFTNKDCTKILMLTDTRPDGIESQGDKALNIRRVLEKEYGDKVIAFAEMGGDNPHTELNKI